MLTDLLPRFLFLLGLGFLVANLRAALDLTRWVRRRASAALVWPAPRPPFYGLNLAIGVMLGCLLLFKILRQADSLSAIFGELMMFVYFGYAVPLSTRIKRGLYADGIWTDGGFMPYEQIGGLSWKEGERATLVVASRVRTTARRLDVPGPLLGEVRSLLREKISTHAIEFDGGPGLHLGERDVRDSV
jgi:hypothetical protein